jgi:hypothetical protein
VLLQVREMDPKSGAVYTNTRVYTDLEDLEPAPAPSRNVSASASTDSQSSHKSSDKVSRASEPKTPPATVMNYDALADSLNEQYSALTQAAHPALMTLACSGCRHVATNDAVLKLSMPSRFRMTL